MLCCIELAELLYWCYQFCWWNKDVYKKAKRQRLHRKKRQEIQPAPSSASWTIDAKTVESLVSRPCWLQRQRRAQTAAELWSGLCAMFLTETASYIPAASANALGGSYRRRLWQLDQSDPCVIHSFSAWGLLASTPVLQGRYRLRSVTF